MIHLRFVAASVLAIALICGLSPAACAEEPVATATSDPAQVRALPTDIARWRGDFDGMLKRRQIRVLVPYSRTLYFNDKGKERGVTADDVRDFETYLNKKYRKQLGNRPITVYLIPTTRDQLLRKVADGLGDIAAGNLTVTDERKKVLDFVAPADHGPVSEVVVTGPKSPPVTEAHDLSGKTVHVRKASSYYESLTELNRRLTQEGKPAANLVLVPDALEDEDMLEMLNVGLLQAMVVDDWKARIWAKLLPRIKINEEAVVRGRGLVGWGIRKGSPKLAVEVNDYYKVVKKQGTLAWRRVAYYNRIKHINDATGAGEKRRFEDMLDVFKKYGRQYGFDPLMLAAQGFQESQLDQRKKSRVGAIGIMQVMPATGAAMKVGDIRLPEANIHAGTKYMDHLMDDYFRDAKFDEANRSLFAFAAYNAGPTRIAALRKQAARRGLDPDKWFNNVEIIAAEKVGMETTTYVRNIFKYYTAYKLMLELEETQRKAREMVKAHR